MMNKAINTLVLATVDSLTKFKNKLAYYLAIFAMVFGSTFGTFNAANAADVVIDNGETLAITDKNGDTGGNMANDGTEDYVLTGTSTINAIGGMNVLSLDFNAASAVTTTVDNGTLTVATVDTNDDAAVSQLKTSADGHIIVTGAVTSSDAAAGNVVKFVLESGSTLTMSGTAANNGIIDGGGATFTVSSGAVRTQSGIIGGAEALGTLDLDGTLTMTGVATTVGILDLDGTMNGVGTTLTANGVSTLDGSVDVVGGIVLTGASTLEDTTTLEVDVAGSGGEEILFGATLNSTANENNNITLVANVIEFDGIVGGATNGGLGNLIITGALDLDAAIADVETLTVSSTTSLGAAITTTGTTGTTMTFTDGVTLTAASTLTTANTDISLEEVAGAANLTLVAGTGDVTASGAITAVTTMTVTSAGTATFAAVTNATETQLDSTGTNSFGGILTSPIVDINAGTTTFVGKVTASTSLDVAGANTIVNIDLAPDVGLLNIDAGTVNISVKDVDISDLDMDGGKIVIEKTVVTGDTIFKVNAQATAGMGTGAGSIIMPVNLGNGGVLRLLEDGGTIGTTTASVEVVVNDTVLTDYVASLDGNNMDVTSTDKSASTTATELGVNANAAKALLQARNSSISDTNVDGTAEDAFFNILNAQNGFTITDATALALQAAPQTDTIGGATTATRTMTGTVQGIVSNRMASLRSGDAFATGMSAGNGMTAQSAFIQAFGSEAEQKNDIIAGATTYGYDSQTTGVAIGFDGMTETGETIGLSASYSNTDVDGKGTGKSTNEIDSYTVSVYADKVTNYGYMEGSLTYGINDNTSSRIVNSAGLSRTYAGNYDSQQISLKVGGGSPNEVGDSTFVTPFASATASMITTDAYTETSTTTGDNLRLKIAQDDINSLVATVGVKAHMVTDNGTPMISFAINNEFGDTTINSTNTYTGGGTGFVTSTEVEELSATLGLGFAFGNDMTSLNINYEANAHEEDYLSHYGTVKIVSKF